MTHSSSLDESISHWRSAENRLYPVVMTRPDLYELCVRLVRAVADDLGSARSPEQLLEAYGRAGEVAAEAVRRTNLSTEGIDLGLVAGAAFSLRYRELLEEMNREEAMRRIREGRERGAEWVPVYETGPGLLSPYRRLEMRLADGRGLHIFVEPDPATGGPLYGVEAIQLDPRTGDWLPDAAPLSPRQTFTDPDEWEAAIDTARER
jgi:hypothetical protein